jgi:hypothetical protein
VTLGLQQPGNAASIPVWPVAASANLTLPAGGSARVEATVTGLDPGEHKYTFRFRGSNTVDADEQLATVTIKAKHGWRWPLLWLLLGIVVSWGFTKGVQSVRTRAELRRKLVAAGSLRSEEPTFPEMWLRAQVRLSHDLTRMHLLRSPAVIEERIVRLRLVRDLLSEHKSLRDKIERKRLPRMAHYRAEQALAEPLANITPEVVEAPDLETLKKHVDHIRTELAEAAEWCTDPGKRYQPIIEMHQKRLANEINVTALPADAAVIQKLDELANEVKRAAKSDDLQHLAKTDEQFAKIELLWERRSSDQRDELQAIQALLLERHKTLEELFDAADQLAWQKIKLAFDAGKVEILCSTNGFDALKPLSFQVKFADDSLNQRFLLRARVIGEWTFELEAKSGAVEPAAVKAAGVRVTRFAANPGQLTVGVQLTFRGDKTAQPLKLGPLTVGPTAEFAWMRGLLWAGAVSGVVAAVLAVASGLSTLYFTNATFGSIRDYCLLFLWGAGVDQGKNLLAILGTQEAEKARA